MEGRRKRLKPSVHVRGNVIKSENNIQEIKTLTNIVPGVGTCVNFQGRAEVKKEGREPPVFEDDAFQMADVPTISIHTEKLEQTDTLSITEISSIKIEQTCTFAPAEITDNVDLKIVASSRGEEDDEVRILFMFTPVGQQSLLW